MLVLAKAVVSILWIHWGMLTESKNWKRTIEKQRMHWCSQDKEVRVPLNMWKRRTKNFQQTWTSSRKRTQLPHCSKWRLKFHNKNRPNIRLLKQANLRVIDSRPNLKLNSKLLNKISQDSILLNHLEYRLPSSDLSSQQIHKEICPLRIHLSKVSIRMTPQLECNKKDLFKGLWLVKWTRIRSSISQLVMILEIQRKSLCLMTMTLPQ